MQLEEYKNMYKQEDRHWWYRSLHEMVSIFFEKIVRARGSSLIVLDAGCGTGGTLRSLRKNYPGMILIGLDLFYVALGYCKSDNGACLLQASVEALPFADESVDMVICLDVIYHLNVNNDIAALKEIFRIIKKGGYLLIHLPAFEFLRGCHDRVVYTRERYTRTKLCKRIKLSGFEIVKQSYRNMFVFPAIYLKRITDNYNTDSILKSDLQPLPDWLNNILYFISCFENRIVRHFNLPFGSSVLSLAKKPL